MPYGLPRFLWSLAMTETGCNKVFDIGWAELLIVGMVALFVIGPKDIPAIAYQIGKFFRRMRYMQYALTGQFEDFMQAKDNQTNAAQPAPKKKELDHDPFDEAEADAELMDIIPVLVDEEVDEKQNSEQSDLFDKEERPSDKDKAAAP